MFADMLWSSHLKLPEGKRNGIPLNIHCLLLQGLKVSRKQFSGLIVEWSQARQPIFRTYALCVCVCVCVCVYVCPCSWASPDLRSLRPP